MATTVKRLLAISYFMPPLVTPRSIQVARTMKVLSKLGWECTVLSVTPQSAGPYAKKVDYSLLGSFSGFYQNIQIESPERSRIIYTLRRALKFLFQFPDPMILWKKGVVRQAAQLISRNEYSGMVTYAVPWTDHLIGLELQRLFGIPWLAHFSDPWVDSPYARYLPLQYRINIEQEKSVISNADAVVFVSSQTADLVMKKYPASLRSKVSIVPHGFETLEFSNNTEPTRKQSKLKIVYTGSFYGPRTPETLIRGISKLQEQDPFVNQLDILLVGWNTSKYEDIASQLKVGDIIRFREEVPVKEVEEITAEADVLLVIDAPNEFENPFLPSKLVDYLAFNKPIIGITPLDGATADLLSRLKCPIVAPEDIRGIADTFETLLKDWRQGRFQIASDFKKVARKYEIRTTTKAFEKQLYRLIAT